MTILAMDHIVVAVTSVEDATAPWERLGFNFTPRMEHAGAGSANRVAMIGDSPANAFYIELLEVLDPAAARLDHYALIAASGGGLARLMFEVDDLDAMEKSLAEASIPVASREVLRDDGSKIGDVITPIGETPAAVPLGFMKYVLEAEPRYKSRKDRGRYDQGFPLKRLDHLAAIPADAEESRRFWTETLGIPQFGTVENPVMRIHQFKAGDAIFELLEAATPESPIAARPPGPASMAAFEVPDLEAAVALARERGLTCSDPGHGALPGTHTATIPPTELSGLALQLLQYD